jgi:hypothetical protein
MKQWFSIICMCLALQTIAQYELTGKVKEDTGTAVIAGASVFLSNTSIGTVTNTAGEFALQVPAGKYELVVSSIGFERAIISLSNQSPGHLTIVLKRKSAQLTDVVVTTYEKDGWNKWGKFFLESFVGTSQYAADCVITNTADIKFRNDRKEGRLYAFSYEPLIIVNNALGYTMQYELQSFEYDFKRRYLLFLGYPLFKEMKGRKGQERRWQQMRQQAYEGSMMHFMRALFRNQLDNAGFEIRHLKKLPNHEKLRVKEIRTRKLINTKGAGGQLLIAAQTNTDSSNYFEKVMRQPDVLSILNPNKLPADSIAYDIDSTTAALDFKDYLYVYYTKRLADAEYAKQFPDNGRSMISEITLLNPGPLQVLSNGTYFPPTELLSVGYWAWSEKIASMLPFNYMPAVK